MSSLQENLQSIKSQLPDEVTLIAVSKNQPADSITELYEAGHRDFGENRVQELMSKYEMLPPDIRWHLIGHLQTNKVKYIASFVHLIHSVDSLKLLEEISRQAQKQNRTIDCLLEIHIAKEESKYGLSYKDANRLIAHITDQAIPNIRICGLMGMATNAADETAIRSEFRELKIFFDRIKKDYFEKLPCFSILSMGMSGDYRIAIGEGSTMVRVGTAIFGVK